MKGIREILMARDGLTAKEAEDAWQTANHDIQKIISSPGASLSDVEDEIAMHFGLEPDFIMEFLL